VITSVLTVDALGTTVYSGILGSKIATEGGSAPVKGGTVPSSGTPDQVAKLQQQQRILQWVRPALVGGIVICGRSRANSSGPRSSSGRGACPPSRTRPTGCRSWPPDRTVVVRQRGR
jgi:hypothetical protein